MTRNVHFGDGFYVALLRILNKVAKLFVSVMLLTCQFGLTLHFHAPTLVIGEVNLEYIVFVTHHLVDEKLYVLNGQEMTRRVEHQSAKTKAGRIANFQSRNTVVERVALVAHQDLIKRCDGAKKSLGRCCH